MVSKCAAVAVMISGAAITYVMSFHPLAHRADLDETGSPPAPMRVMPWWVARVGGPLALAVTL